MAWSRADKDALLRLAIGLKISENHLRDLMDWLEEVALRDRIEIHDVLARKAVADIESDPRLGRADKLKRIKEQVRRLRFPRLAQTEDALRARIHELKLHPEITLSLPPGLEGGRLQVQFSASTEDEFKRLSAKLAQILDRDSVREIFRLLAGRATENG